MKTDATSSDHHHHAAGGLSPRFLRHANFPLGNQPLTHADGTASGVGSCGDRITVQIRVEDDCLREIRALPAGCVYTVACASALCGLAMERPLNEALELQPESVAAALGGLPPDHLHCARLAVNTMGEAIDAYLQKQWGPKPVPPSL
jgi:nitrogen fixation NifU-like protein